MCSLRVVRRVMVDHYHHDKCVQSSELGLPRMIGWFAFAFRELLYLSPSFDALVAWASVKSLQFPAKVEKRTEFWGRDVVVFFLLQELSICLTQFARLKNRIMLRRPSRSGMDSWCSSCNRCCHMPNETNCLFNGQIG